MKPVITKEVISDETTKIYANSRSSTIHEAMYRFPRWYNGGDFAVTNDETQKPCQRCGGQGKLYSKEVQGIPPNFYGGVPPEVLNPNNVRITEHRCPDCHGTGIAPSDSHKPCLICGETMKENGCVNGHGGFWSSGTHVAPSQVQHGATALKGASVKELPENGAGSIAPSGEKELVYGPDGKAIFGGGHYVRGDDYLHFNGDDCDKEKTTAAKGPLEEELEDQLREQEAALPNSESTKELEELLNEVWPFDRVVNSPDQYDEIAFNNAVAKLQSYITEQKNQSYKQGQIDAYQYQLNCDRDNALAGHKWSSGDWRKFVQAELEELQQEDK